MRNEDLEKVAAIFVGDWTVSLTNQRWVEDKTATTSGVAKGDWLDDGFVRFRMWFEGKGDAVFGDTATTALADLGQPEMQLVFGRSDARDRFVTLSHDERGVLRVFDLTLDGDAWLLQREDPDFRQRLVGRAEGIRMFVHPDISQDQGATWIKDFDMTFTRA